MSRHRSFIIGLGTILLGVSAAHAADVKIFSAGFCYEVGGTRTRLDEFGRIHNANLTNAALVACPLVRDVPTLRATRIEVSVVDNNVNSGEDITCRASTVNRFGTTSSGGGPVSTSGASSAGQILNLPIPALTHTDGSFIVRCTIPRKSATVPSHIASIKLTEP